MSNAYFYIFGFIFGSFTCSSIGEMNERRRMNLYKNELLYKSKTISQYNQFLLKNNLLEDYNKFIQNDSKKDDLLSDKYD